MTFWIAFAAMVLSVAHTVLYFVAPRTKTTWDDKALKVVDSAKDKLGD